MFCKECGSQLADNAQFCPQCGTKTNGTGTAPMPTASNDPSQGTAKMPAAQTVHPVQPNNMTPATQQKPTASGVLGSIPRPALIAIIVAVVALVAAIIVVVYTINPGPGSEPDDALRCSVITRVTPTDNNGNKLSDYEAELVDYSNDEVVSTVDVNGTDGFTLESFSVNGSQPPYGYYYIIIRDRPTGAVYRMPTINLVSPGNDTTPEISNGNDTGNNDNNNGDSNSNDGKRPEKESSDEDSITTQEDAEEELTPQQKAYKAYNEKCREYIDRYGEHQADFSTTGKNSTATGLCLALLHDFDNDGIEELVVVYNDKSSSTEHGHHHFMEVWTYGTGQLECVFEGEPLSGEGSYTVFEICYSSDSYKPDAIVQIGDTDSTGSSRNFENLTTYSAMKNGDFEAVDTIRITTSDKTTRYELNGSEVGENKTKEVKDSYQTSPYMATFYYFDTILASSTQSGMETISCSDCFSLTDETLDKLAGTSSSATSTGSAKEPSAEAAAAYQIVLEDWKDCIEKDHTASAIELTYPRTYAVYPRYVDGDDAKGDDYVYAYADLGIGTEPALLVADPANDYKVLGIYQYDKSKGGSGIAKYQAHFRHWKYLCEDGILRSSVNYPGTSEGGYGYNHQDAVEKCSGSQRSNDADDGTLEFDILESVDYSTMSGDGDHCKYTAPDGTTTFKQTGAHAIASGWEEEYPADDSVDWKRIMS